MTDAGKGEHRVYKILSGSDDHTTLTPRKHYFAVDAVAWFINKESSWFTSRMASGTLDIQVAGGLEKYQSALGTFSLKDGAKTAPVFDRPVLPERSYRGGSITLSASLTGIKNDTALGGMLKSAASASLGLVAGMVDTATLAGPARLLSAAGEAIVAGVKKVLSDTGAGREPLFDFAGLEKTLQPGDIEGPHIYVLFFRGGPINEAQLKIKSVGMMEVPYVGSDRLQDGAWLLLKIRRSEKYSGVREWSDATRALRGKLQALVDDFKSGAVTKDDALKQLKPTPTGGQTVFDEFVRLRTIIMNDGVLSEAEAGAEVAALATCIDAAKKAIAAQNAPQFTNDIKALKSSLLAGKRDGAVYDAFDQHFTRFVKERAQLAPPEPERALAGGPAKLSATDLKFIPHILEE